MEIAGLVCSGGTGGVNPITSVILMLFVEKKPQ